jgi:magnesium-transporting ATPase (P-type)
MIAAGTTVYTAVVVVVNLKLAARTKLWMPITHFCFWVWSIGLWFAFVAFLSIGWTEYDVFPELYYVHHVLFKNPSFWFTVILLSAAVLPDIALDALASETVRRRKQARSVRVNHTRQAGEDAKVQFVGGISLNK